MTTVTVGPSLVLDETGRKDSRDWQVYSPVYRAGSDGSVVTTRHRTIRVVAGIFTAKLEPGVCVVQNPDGQRYTITVPNTDADLWDLIAAAVAFPPDTESELLAAAVASYLEDNPPEADWNGLTNKPAVIGAGSTQAAARSAIGAGEQALVDTAANLAASNPIPAVGRGVRELDTGKWKTGDGTTHYNDLPYDVDKSDLARREVVITNNNMRAITSVTIATPGTPQTAEAARVVGISAFGIRLVFENNYTSPAPNARDADPSTTPTLSAGLRTADGQNYALTFGGKRTFTVEPGGVIVSDLLPIQVNKGDVIYPRVYQSAGSSLWNYTMLATTQAPSGGLINGDATNTGAGAIPAYGPWNGLLPSVIIGTPTDPVAFPRAVIVQGQSISYGAGDGVWASVPTGHQATAPQWAGGGFVLRALEGEAGIIQGALGGDNFRDYNTGKGHFRRQAHARYARAAIVGEVTNDLNLPRTLAQAQADLLLLANRNKILGVDRNITWTITPATNSTDNWATLANQTVYTNLATTRTQYNDWVRDGLPIDATTLVAAATGTTNNVLRAGQKGHPFYGWLEVADVVESARNSGKWKVPQAVITDAAITSGSQNMSSASTTFTTADIGKDVIINGAGAEASPYAGTPYVGTITAIVDSHTVTIVKHNSGPGATATVAGATAIFNPLGRDGLHPSTYGNAQIAAAIKPKLLELLS